MPTLKYFIFRTCERWHIKPYEFSDFDFSQQSELLGYEILRQEQTDGHGFKTRT